MHGVCVHVYIVCALSHVVVKRQGTSPCGGETSPCGSKIGETWFVSALFTCGIVREGQLYA